MLPYLQHLSPREALAAPADEYTRYAQSVVILVVSLVSLLGTAWIVASFAMFAQLRTFRHQLILGLAISDFAMGFNFLLSSSLNVGGRWIGAPEQARFCSFNGFMTQLFVLQTDYWVLTIAVCTYLILADHKKPSAWVQSHVLVLWALPWFLSTLLATVGLAVLGYGDIGAWCWFTSDPVRLYVNFVQRWIIVGVMVMLYLKLYYLLFRAGRHFRSFGDSESAGEAAGGGTGNGNGSGSGSGYYTRTLSGQHRRFKRLARLMLLYPIAYAVIWTLPTAIRIYQTVTGQPAPWQLQTVDKACVVLQGFVDAVIYGWTESSFASWRNLLFPRQKLEVGDGDDGDYEQYPNQTIALEDRRRQGKTDAANAQVRKRRDSSSGGSSLQPLGISTLNQIQPGVSGGIRKTVQVEVVSSRTGAVNGDDGSQEGSEVDDVAGGKGSSLSLQRPEKPYFPGGSLV